MKEEEVGKESRSRFLEIIFCAADSDQSARV